MCLQQKLPNYQCNSENDECTTANTGIVCVELLSKEQEKDKNTEQSDQCLFVGIHTGNLETEGTV